MKPIDFLKEKVTYDNPGQYLWIVQKSGHHQKLADLRGWGGIQQLFRDKKGNYDLASAALFQDNLGQCLADAINEKMQRELSSTTKQ
jgi:hypothetical protein